VKPPAPNVYHAVAFLEDLPQRRLSEAFPEARPRVDGLHLASPAGGDVFLYPFGAAVFRGVPPAEREAVLSRLRAVWPELHADTVHEEFQVVEAGEGQIAVAAGTLQIDRLTAERAAVVALIVAQSAAMETYERIVDGLFARARAIVADFERRGTVPMRMKPLHRFIAEALANRNEVLSVLHLLDKPDAVWSDPAMDRIYEDLRDEFDLRDRYEALAVKLRSVQETAEMVLDTARDRRLVLLEAAIVALIVLEIVFGLLRLV
jgi:uncharacterized Rmd1/YagE family protein